VIAAPLPALTALAGARVSGIWRDCMAWLGHGAESERYGFLRALAEEAELDHVPRGPLRRSCGQHPGTRGRVEALEERGLRTMPCR
jgi:hypothetical protein